MIMKIYKAIMDMMLVIWIKKRHSLGTFIPLYL